MKLGKIICDPEEGRELIGKKVVASDSYASIKLAEDVNEQHRFDMTPHTLVTIGMSVGDHYPFDVEGDRFTFVREVLEPNYRPFKSVEELVEVWGKKFGNTTRPKFTMPLVWIKPKDSEMCHGMLVTEFWSDGVCLSYEDGETVEWNELYDDYCFLDGTPCGVEVEE